MCLQTRVATEKGSRRAWCQGVCNFLNLRLTDPNALSVDELAEKNAQVGDIYSIPFSNATAQRRRPYFAKRDWTATDIGYAVFFVPMHIIAFVLGPFTFTWDAFYLACGLYVITGGLGLSMSYHRQLSHKSFRCPKPVEVSVCVDV